MNTFNNLTVTPKGTVLHLDQLGIYDCDEDYSVTFTPDRAWVYMRVMQSDGECGWTSPIFFD